MNFFQAQDRARRNSFLLFALFALAVASLAILIYIVAAAALHWPEVSRGQWPEFNSDLFAKTSGGILAVVFFGSAMKTLALASGGGAAVAQAMGGKLIPPSTRDPLERRLINVVEEMSIASGVPAPQTYLLPDNAINAFAAGTRPDNAAIGMTRGALQTLSRDELQGVVAHEFSHILNGDMRLNIRLMGILHGILIVGYIGYFILRSSLYSGAMRGRDRSGAAAALPLIGLALVVIGFAGVFFGNWIRAAVSRQREFLADASAVQFTRNPRGIGGALEKIGRLSGILQNSNAAEIRHMCISDSTSSGFANPFATHPPLQERIRRIIPNWNPDQPVGSYDDKTEAAMKRLSGSPDSVGVESGSGTMGFSSSSLGAEKRESGVELVGRTGELRAEARDYAERLRGAIAPELAEAAHDAHSARALLYAMLMDVSDAESCRAQLEVVRLRGDAGVHAETVRLLGFLGDLPRGGRMALAEMSAPALRCLSLRQRRLFAANMDALVAADGQMDLREWCLQASVLHHLSGSFGAKPPRRTRLDGVLGEGSYALSILSRAGHPESEAAAREAFAYGSGLDLATRGLVFDGSEFDSHRLLDAARKLGGLVPREKEKFLSACAACAERDGVISADERDLLSAFASLLDCPMPPV